MIVRWRHKPYHWIFVYNFYTNRWWAYIEEFPGTIANGVTQGEASENLIKAVNAWILQAQGDGENIPKPNPDPKGIIP